MIGFVMVGTNDLEQSVKFYDLILPPLRMIKIYTSEQNIGYASEDSPNIVNFYITKPQNKKNATNGNGTMIAFKADSKKNVDKFYSIALDNGGVNEGSPGLRYDNNYYAYVRDMDGNKICAFYLCES